MKNRIGYETTDREVLVDIYGLEFKVNKNVEDYDVNTIMKGKSEEQLDVIIDDLLGNGALSKINEKRVHDGYKEADLEVKITIIAGVVQFYIKELTKPFEKISKTYREATRRINNGKNYKRYRRY